MKNTNIVLTIIIILIILVGGYFALTDDTSPIPEDENSPEMGTTTPGTMPPSTTTPTSTDPSDDTAGDGAMDEDAPATAGQQVIGTSVEGRDITAYSFGSGETSVLFLGGIHGGYSLGTTLLSEQLVDYFQSSPDVIPENVQVTVVSMINPDGVASAVGGNIDSISGTLDISASARVASRFNANGVDLNRNFACNWQSSGMWQSREVDGGTSAFSEPESAAIRDYVAQNQPDAVVAYYAAAGSVYSSACNGSPSQESTDLMNIYAAASGYDAAGEFTAYEVSGDMANWLASEGIPSISVLLSEHMSPEWSMNQAGVDAVLEAYAQ